MKRIISAIGRFLGPHSGHPALSGFLFAALSMPIIVFMVWVMQWIVHWLPWPGGAL
ncbi:hypothetical protein [Pandoraea norimbergensis]